jgi:hypothetical protein
MAPLNLGGINDLAGITEIETLNLGAGSRRGSFSKPNPLKQGGSELKERPRDTTSVSGIPRPQTGGAYEKQRPLT